MGIIIYCFTLFVVPWLEAFAISRGQMMLAIFCLQATVGLASPFLGRLFDQYSIRTLVIIGVISISLGLFGLSQARHFWQVAILYATFLPVGLVLCGTLASQTLVSKWFTRNRSLAIGISASGTSMGGFIFPCLQQS